MKGGFFVTGTDTNVGKTWTTIALMRRLQIQGLRVVGMKPVAAGCERQDDILKNSDALLMQQYASLPLEYQQINPYAFEAAISPHLACGDVEVSVDVIADAFIRLQQLADVVIVEGAGGWYSPLSNVLDNSGLAQALHLPVVLVVGIKLGCINHARLTISAIRQAGLSCAGWVAVQIDPAMPGFDGNLAFLSEAIDAPLLGVLPFLAAPDFELLAMSLSLSNWQKFDVHQKK
ncbi:MULTISPECIES: dethiobiotin synthase [Methylomonas]|uniref:ATP-dependent dethiobiotin synthetase BioD n=2 Tax=Methylomonas TaxID=416 RepID=A0A140E3I2_9GAMM|nr:MULTISPECIES: dethiobiotin synthase [Methylomonas]AMK74956.1 dethiobiotin synthetase [Methylomonas denitrificans]OAI05817.1 dethiobiotin synthase [Methylomonas methanica]TCV80973.1 dethiobiotin synthase [Methylomonas methanica]